MSVAWSRRRGDEPEDPDHPYILAGIEIDPANPNVVARAYLPLTPVPYSRPDDVQEDGVIEPTALFKRSTPETGDIYYTVEFDED